MFSCIDLSLYYYHYKHNAICSIKGFYRGFIPCVARAFPANGAMLLTVSQLMSLDLPFGFGSKSS